jgi:hypothetical protein
LANAAFIPLGETDPLDAGRGLSLITRLGSTLYEGRWTATEAGGLDLTVSLPRPAGGTSFYVFPGVSVEAGARGKVELDLLRSTSVLTLSIDRDGDGIFEEVVESATEEVIESSGPKLLAATAVGPETLSGADPWGRIVALLFDREIRLAEAETASNFSVAENEVLAAIRQLSGRLVFLFLRDPVGEIVPRQATVSGLFDTAGQPMIPATVSLPITSRLVDPGALVTGRVLQADGTPLTGAQIFYLNTSRVAGLFAISAKEVESDGSYRFDYVRRSPHGPFGMRAIDPSTLSSQELTTSVRTNGEHIVVDLVLLGRGGVTGTVRDLNGIPVPGAQVLVTSQTDPTSFFLTETDGEGRYEATGIIVGPVVVKARCGGGEHPARRNVHGRRCHHQSRRRPREWWGLRDRSGARYHDAGSDDRAPFLDPGSGPVRWRARRGKKSDRGRRKLRLRRPPERPVPRPGDRCREGKTDFAHGNFGSGGGYRGFRLVFLGRRVRSHSGIRVHRIR